MDNPMDNRFRLPFRCLEMRAAHLMMVVGLVACALASVSTAARAEPGPCGGLTFGEGAITFGERLTLARVAEPAGDECLKAVAAELVKRQASVQVVTIAARVANDKTMRDAGLAAANAAADKLAAAGVPRSLVSVVVPTAAADEKDGLYVSFIERRSSRPIAQLWALSGKAWAGPDVGATHETEPGATMVAKDVVETGKGSRLVLRLIDDSEIALDEETSLRVIQADLAADGARAVKLQLLRGSVTVKTSRRDGPFLVQTAIARAGQSVGGERGAVFRLTQNTATQKVFARLEVLEGTMTFGGKRADEFIDAGKAAEVDNDGTPENVRHLLVAPELEGPLFGGAQAGDVLRWKEVAAATQYRVELSQNAQFTKAWWPIEASTERWLLSEMLTPGKWFWRVTALDADGYAGYPSKVYAFTLPAAGPTP